MTLADGAGCGACGFGLVSRALGGLGTPPYGHYDPCARSSLDALGPRLGPDPQARPEVEKNAAVERREARVPRGTRRVSPARSCCAVSALRSPQVRGEDYPQTSGAVASRERGWLSENRMGSLIPHDANAAGRDNCCTSLRAEGEAIQSQIRRRWIASLAFASSQWRVRTVALAIRAETIPPKGPIFWPPKPTRCVIWLPA